MKIFNKFLFSILFVAGVITAIIYGFSYTISEIFRRWNDEIYKAAMSIDYRVNKD